MPGAWGRLGPVAPPDLRLVLKPVPAAGASWEPPSPLGYSLLWVLEMLHGQGRLQPQGTSERVVLQQHLIHAVRGSWGPGAAGSPPAQPEGCPGLRVPRRCPSPTPALRAGPRVVAGCSIAVSALRLHQEGECMLPFLQHQAHRFGSVFLQNLHQRVTSHCEKSAEV